MKSVIERSFQGLKQCNGKYHVCPDLLGPDRPEEGKYDYSSVDTLIRISRKYESKLIFLLVRALEERRDGLCSGLYEVQPEQIQTGDCANRAVLSGSFLHIARRILRPIKRLTLLYVST